MNDTAANVTAIRPAYTWLGAVSRWLQRLLRLTPGQLRQIGFLWLLSAGIVISVRLAWVVVQTTLIKRLGVEYLPWLFVGESLVTLVGGSLFALVADRVATVRLIRWVTLAGMIAFAAAGLTMPLVNWDAGLTLGSVAFYTLLLLAVYGVLLNFFTLLNLLVGSLFAVEESQRLYPLLDTGISIGGIIGGALVGWLTTLLPLASLFWVAAAALAAVLISLQFTGRLFGARSGVSQHVAGSTREHLASGWRFIGRSRFVVLLGIMLSLSYVLTQFISFEYNDLVNATFGSEEAMAGFLGIFSAAFNVVALLFDGLVQSRLTKRWGITRLLYLPPAVVLVGFLALFGWPVIGVYLVVMSVRDLVMGLQGNIYLVTQFAISRQFRARVMNFFDNYVFPIALLIGSGLVWLMNRLLPGKEFLTLKVQLVAGLGVLFMLIRLLLIGRFQKQYFRLLDENLAGGEYQGRLRAIEALAEERFHREREQGRISLERIIQDQREGTSLRQAAAKSLGAIADQRSLPSLLRALASERLSLRLAVVQALASYACLGQEFTRQALSRERLLEVLRERFQADPEPTVKVAILDTLVALRDPGVVQLLLAALRSGDRMLTAEVIQIMGRFGDPVLPHYLRPALRHADPRVRANALVALWQYPDERLVLRQQLSAMLSSAQPREYASTLYAIGELGLREEVERLRRGLSSPQRAVQRQAAIALAKLNALESGQHGAPPELLLQMLLSDDLAERAQVRDQLHAPSVPVGVRQLLLEQAARQQLQYPAALPASESLNADLARIPLENLARLREIYQRAGDTFEYLKIDEYLGKADRQARSSPEPFTVIVVEENDELRRLYAIRLLAAGYRVHGVSDLAELPADLAARPQLLLLSVDYTGLDWLGTLKQVRSDERLQALPVFLLVSFSEQGAIGQGRTLGANGYLYKSHFNPDEALEVVQRVRQRQALGQPLGWIDIYQ